MTDRTELYIIITKKDSTESREVGPLTVRGYGRAHANLKRDLPPDESMTQLVVRTVRVINEETHGIAKASAVLKSIAARSREAEIDAEIERLVQEKRKLQGSLNFDQPDDEPVPASDPDDNDLFHGHDPA